MPPDRKTILFRKILRALARDAQRAG